MVRCFSTFSLSDTRARRSYTDQTCLRYRLLHLQFSLPACQTLRLLLHCLLLLLLLLLLRVVLSRSLLSRRHSRTRNSIVSSRGPRATAPRLVFASSQLCFRPRPLYLRPYRTLLLHLLPRPQTSPPESLSPSSPSSAPTPRPPTPPSTSAWSPHPFVPTNAKETPRK